MAVKGTKRPGPAASLTDAQVMAIRTSHEKGGYLATLFGVSSSHINRIRNGERYSHLPGARKPRKAQFSAEQILEIRRLRAGGMTRREVAEKFNTKRNTIQFIDERRAYKWVKE